MFSKKLYDIRALSALGTLLLLLFIGGLGYAAYWFFYPLGGEEVTLIIPRGTSLAGVSDTLSQQGIVNKPALALKWLLKLTGGSSRVRAGEFHFSRGGSLFAALRTLYSSEPILHAVTIPEGWRITQIAERLEDLGLVNQNRFLNLALSREMAARFRLTSPHLEGFLFPDTYKFSKIDGEERILETMVSRMVEKFEKDMKREAQASGFTLETLVTFASIVERETGAPQERPLIAAVFHNRIKKRMRLQSDPTTIYGIPNFNGNLTKDDLKRQTPYNTYVIPGLPPGPIASPGIASLKAVLNPADVTYLYFVSKNNGLHHFSSTYMEHAKQVNSHQRKAPHGRTTAKQK